MKALVFAGFLLGGWNVASGLSVAKDTQSGKMPGPKSFGYTLAALLGVTGATLSYYAMKGQENPQLLASDSENKPYYEVMVDSDSLSGLNYGEFDGARIEFQENLHNEVLSLDYGEGGDEPPMTPSEAEKDYMNQISITTHYYEPDINETTGEWFGEPNTNTWGGTINFPEGSRHWEGGEYFARVLGFKESELPFESYGSQLEVEKKIMDYIQRNLRVYVRERNEDGEFETVFYLEDYGGEGTAKEVVCVRCNGLGDLCRGCSGLGADYPEEFGSCTLPPFPCPYCDTTGLASVNENMELVRKGLGNMGHYFDSANQELFGPKYLFAMKDNPTEDYHHPWIQLDDAKAAKLFDWIQDKYGIHPEYSQDIWENTPHKYKQEYDFPTEAASQKVRRERMKKEYPELFKESEGWLTEGKCAICNNEAKFVVEDLPVGPRGFCCEACYADYVGLPVKEEGYYGLASEGKSWQGVSLAGTVDEIEEMLGRKKEAESQTFEAPKVPYTNADQEAFTKSYSRKAKLPWNKITQGVSFPKLGNQGRYQYISSKITIPAANVTKAGGKKAAISRIRQYAAVAEYARVGWNTRLNSPDDPNNQDLMEKQYGEVMQQTMLGSSGKLGVVMGLRNSIPFQNNPGDHMEDIFTRANIISDRWESQIQGYIDTARMMRDLVRAGDGFMKNIKMIGSNYAPVENDGGYGRTSYSARNPYINAPTEGGYKYDDNDGTLKLPGDSYQYGKEWAILDKIRFYEATPPYKVGRSVAGTSYETEGGYGWRTSGSTTTNMDQPLCNGNNGNVSSPERWSVQPVSFWGQSFSGDIGYYDIEDWETDRTPNYLYGTLVPWVRMPFMDKTNGDELNDIIIKLLDAKKSIKTKAEAAKKKEEQQAAAKQQREDQTNAINSFYTIQEEIDRLVKRKVNAATAAGIDPADILVYLEDLQVELEAYMTDLDLDEYLMEE
jgi:hypothetical protein